MPCGRLIFLGFRAVASVATGAIPGVPKDMGWLLLATRGWRGFCFLQGYN